METRTTLNLFSCLLLVASLTCVACGGDDDPDAGTPTVDDGPPAPDVDMGMDPVDEGMPDAGPLPDPLFAVCTLQFTPEGSVGILALVDSLDEGEIDTENALEIPGLGSCAGRDGEVWVGSSEAPTITRYEVTDDGELEEGETLSVMSLGITSLFSFSGFDIVDENKAYYFDSITLQVAIFDPAEMVLLGDIDLSGVDDAAGSFAFSNFGGTVRTPERTIAFARYLDPTVERTASRTTLAIVDNATDELVLDTTDGCGGIASGDVLSNGDAFFGSNNITAADHRLGLDGSFPPCLVRLPAGSDEIDETFDSDLNALTGGLPTGGLVPGPGDSSFVLAYDETVVPIGEETLPREIQAAAAWRLWFIPELGGTEPATRVDNFGLTSGANFALEVDGVTYFSRIAADFSSAQLIRVNADGTVQEALDTGGITLGAYRVR